MFPSSKPPQTAMQEKTALTKAKRKKAKKSSSAAKKPSRGITSLVAQWQKAKNEIALEDRMLEEEDEEDPVTEELTQQQIEKWKQQQITSGKAYSNANFEPVPDDWRSRLLQKKKKKV